MQAVDPEGTAITYGIAYANLQMLDPQLAADTVLIKALVLLLLILLQMLLMQELLKHV